MKLWQKIFLYAFALIIVVINTTAISTVLNGHQLLLEKEQKRAVAEQRYMCESLSSQLTYQRLKQDLKLFTDYELQQMVTTWGESNNDETKKVLAYPTYPKDYYLYAEDQKLLNLAGNLIGQSEETEGYLSKIVEDGGNSYIIVASNLNLKGISYQFVTQKQITDIYSTLDKQLEFVRISSMASAIIVGIILMGFTYKMIAPLSRINRGLQKITEGNYTLRIPEKNAPEMKELSHNINAMAESVENNIERLQMQADNRKQFVYSLAHEMKTPLTSILGFADILRSTNKLSEAQREDYASVIVEEAKRLRSLSGKLLELSMANNVDLEYQTVFIPDLLKEISLTLQPILAQKKMKLMVQDCPVSADMDVELMKSVLYNLIENAMKASGEGQGISLTCESEETVVFIVQDYGIGMSEQECRLAAEPFYMADKLSTRQAGGTGLGLVLCTAIVNQHGGSLQIKSTKGEGTVVSVTLPLCKGELK